MTPSPNLGLGLHGERKTQTARLALTLACSRSLAPSLSVSMRKAGLGPSSVYDKRRRPGSGSPVNRAVPAPGRRPQGRRDEGV